MARTEDLPSSMRENLMALPCPRFEDAPFIGRRSLDTQSVALISSAGIAHRNDPPFAPGAYDYREIDERTPDADILMSHVSVNFDRTGFQQDLEVVLPRQRLRDMADDGVIGSAAASHYSFMGATDPALMEPSARELATELKHRQITAAVLLPV